MTTIRGLLGRDWGNRHVDESGQWIQRESGGDAVSSNSVPAAQPSVNSLLTGWFDAPSASILAAKDAAARIAAPAPQAPPPTPPATPSPRERSAEEWARISAAWNGSQGDFYRLYQAMHEQGWDAADIAHVSGMSLQDVGDYFTCGGAPAGFGGAVTLGRDAVAAPYLAAIAAETAHPPSGPDAARPWWTAPPVSPWSAVNESGTPVDESGNTLPLVTFDLGAFTAWYLTQNTPEARTFARIHGAFSSDTAGSLRFASGAVVSLGGFSASGWLNAASMYWAMDKRITQYEGYAKSNPLQLAAMRDMLDKPLNQDIVRVFGPSASASAAPRPPTVLGLFSGIPKTPASVPGNEMGERMRALYGTDLANDMLRLTAATDAMRARYLDDLNAAMSQPGAAGAGQAVAPWWTPSGTTGAGQYGQYGQYGEDGEDGEDGVRRDANGAPLPDYSFDAAAFQAWYASQGTPESQLIAQVYGSGVSKVSLNGFSTAGQLDSLDIAIHYDEAARPYARDVTLGSDLVRVDIGDPPEMHDAGQVIYLPMQGFVTSAQNIKSNDDWLDRLAPIAIVAFFAYFAAPVVGNAAAMGAVGTTTGPVAAVISAGAVGAATAAVSGVMSGDPTLKGILQGALAGALTAGLMQNLPAGTPAAIVARATVQGGVQALLGGSFRDGALAGFASALGEAVTRQIDEGIRQALASGAMSASEALTARYFSSMTGAAIRIVAQGRGADGYDVASAFMQALIREAGSPDAAPVVQLTVSDPVAQAPEQPPVADADGSDDPVTGTSDGEAPATPAPDMPAPPVSDAPEYSGEAPAAPQVSPPAGALPIDAQAVQSGFLRNNGDFANAQPNTIVGELKFDPTAPPVPDALLPAGAASGQMRAFTDGAGTRFYFIADQNQGYRSDLFTTEAQRIVDQGVAGLQSGATTAAQYLEASRFIAANAPVAAETPDDSRVIVTMTEEQRQEAIRYRLLRDQVLQQGIVPMADPDGFVGPLTQPQAELLAETGYLLNDADAVRFAQLRDQGQLLSQAAAGTLGAGLTYAPLAGAASMVDGVLTFAAGAGRVLVGAAAVVAEGVGAIGGAAALPLVLLFIPNRLGAPPPITQLNDTQRFVLDPDSETHGHVEELSPGGQWLVNPKMTDVQLGVVNGQYVALTDDDIRKLYPPITTPNAPLPPTGTPPLVPPNDGSTNASTPGQAAAQPSGPTVDPLPAPSMEQQSWRDLIINSNTQNSDGFYGNIPEDSRWRYDRYLSESNNNNKLGPDEWYEKAQTAWENNSAGNEFEQAARARLSAPLGVGSKPVSIEGYIPDLPVGNKYGVTDIKNVVDLSNDDQLRAFYKYAADNKLPFNIIIGPRTQTISEPLLDSIRSTGGSVIQYTPEKNEFANVDIGESGSWTRSKP